MIRRLALALLASTALGAVPAFAGHNEPVSAAQLPFMPLALTGGQMSGLQSWPALGSVDLTYAGAGQSCGAAIPNVVALKAGNAVSFDPTQSCVNTVGDPGHQLSSALFSATSHDDAHAEEQTVAIHGVFQTGYKKPYASSTAYNVGDNYSVNGFDYRVTVAGTTAATPPSYPTSRPAYPYTITDGSLTALEINDSAVDGKLNLYSEATVKPGAGATWNMTLNTHIQPSYAGNFVTGSEEDFVNSNADCAIGTCTYQGRWMTFQGYRSTAGINMSGGNSSAQTYGVHWGIWCNGTWFASDSCIRDDTGAANGWYTSANATHSDATIRDDSASKYMIESTGNKQTADIFLPSGSPIAVNIGGSHSAEAYSDTSTSPAALSLTGKYSVAAIVLSPQSGSGKQIAGTGFAFDAAGNETSQTIQLNNYAISALPACTGSTHGQIAYVSDANSGTISWHGNVSSGGGQAYNGLVTCNGINWIYE